jgi:hypothetical protein
MSALSSKFVFKFALLLPAAQIMDYEQLELPESAGGQPEPDIYQTLGQFYQAIEDGEPLYHFPFSFHRLPA